MITLPSDRLELVCGGMRFPPDARQSTNVLDVRTPPTGVCTETWPQGDRGIADTRSMPERMQQDGPLLGDARK